MYLPGRGATLDRSHPLARGLISYWPFLEATGDKLQDINRQNVGTLTGMDPATDWIGSGQGMALDFDGTNDYVATGLSLASRPAFTLSGWVARRASNSLVYLSGDGGNQVQIGFFSDGNVYVSIDGANFFSTASNSTSLIHVVLTYDGAGATKLRFYINGVQVTLSGDTALTTTHASAGNLDIGRRNTGSLFTDGRITRVGVWDRKLETAEIVELCRNSNWWIHRPSPGRFSFEEAAAAATNHFLLLLGAGS